MNKRNDIELGLFEIVEEALAAETAADLRRQADDLDAKADSLEAFDREFLAACARLEVAAGMGTHARYAMRQAFDAAYEAWMFREWAKEARQEAELPAPRDLRVHKRRVRY